MAENTVLNPGVGGDTIATEDLGASGKIQRMKLVKGAKDVDQGDISATNPLPIIGYVTPDSGTTIYPLFGNASGIQTTNSVLQTGSAVAGIMHSYLTGVGLGLTPSTVLKILKGSRTTNGSYSFTDQSGSAYSTVTAGKTLYFGLIVASTIMVTNNTHNYGKIVFGDETNQPLIFEVSSACPTIIPVGGLQSIAATKTLTATLSLVGSANTVDLTVYAWEQ